ncbi:MAG: CehA/McbA family metallohydrolase [Gemmataceae bacterium]|nr:CehA/McbA family metallohydrolase [Gemmataceae bacterium]
MKTLRDHFVRHPLLWLLAMALVAGASHVAAQNQKLEPVDVEGQPLAANVTRLVQAYDFLGTPLSAEQTKALQEAAKDRNAKKLQELLDPHVLVVVTINPESRVKAARGPATVALQQGGYTPILIKVLNDSTVTKPLRISSPQAGPIFSGGSAGNVKPDKDRFLDVELFNKQPLTANLSGLKVEYALALIHSSEAGKREATLHFDVGQGTQDIGFRGEVPILFTIKPAIPVKLTVKDMDGKPTVGRFTFKDKAGRVYPPQAKRLAPDFFFQQQVYRADGGSVLLPPGELTMTYGRGPEYKLLERKVTISDKGDAAIEVKLDRWINTMDHGFYSGDHHIHAAGCAHYTSPTEGVFAKDMFLHVKGEGLNVGCNLTWGPCYEFQRQFFEPGINKLSEPFCLLKYDIEVSGFGSQALGHVCLLNLREQTYPGSDGTKTKGWPTWTTPLMKWAKAQGAYTGYAHSASGLAVNPQAAAKRLLTELDADKDGKLSKTEAAKGLLPEDFVAIDADKDGFISEAELTASIGRVANKLPNLAIPEMNGIGAQEICVTSAQGICDFISAMDTARVPEWNCWYHIMNCGYPLKVSGETDFPCISGSRVGQGRVYVQMGKVDKIDFAAWCEGLAKGRSYVSDGYAHAVEFTVNDKAPGANVALEQPGMVTVKAKVAFAAETPLGTANGGTVPTGKTRLIELIVNGKVAATKEVPADDKLHDVDFKLNVERSSWVALRHFPQMHTNPVNVLVGGKPIRTSRGSALWCIGVIEQLWRVRGQGIAANEREEADKTFKWAIEQYRKIAMDAPQGS